MAGTNNAGLLILIRKPQPVHLGAATAATAATATPLRPWHLPG